MELKKFRERYGVQTKEIIEELSKVFPNYTKGVHSMAEHPERYGVQLTSKAVSVLKRRFTPVSSEASGASQSSPKKRAVNKVSLTVRLSRDERRELNFLIERSGAKTTQDFLQGLIKNAIDQGGNSGADL